MNEELIPYGFAPRVQADFEQLGRPSWLPGRVLIQERSHSLVRLADQDDLVPAAVPGRMKHTMAPVDLPSVGDWVAVEEVSGGYRLRAVLPRGPTLTRTRAGMTSAGQVLAANVEVVAIAMAAELPVNPRKLERWLTQTAASGARAVVLLTKRDLAEDPAGQEELARTAAGLTPVLWVSSFTREGLSEVRGFVGEGETMVLLGASGAGKSTLTNALLGAEVLETQGVRGKDGKGRHTTTRRSLHLLPGGGCLVDTPGIRELELHQAEAGLAEAFQDIDDLAEGCRFSDCSHSREPGCALRTAIENGELSRARWESYCKLAAEEVDCARRRKRRTERERRRQAQRR